MEAMTGIRSTAIPYRATGPIKNDTCCGGRRVMGGVWWATRVVGGVDFSDGSTYLSPAPVVGSHETLIPRILDTSLDVLS